MNPQDKNAGDQNSARRPTQSTEQQSSNPHDLPDSKHDEERLKNEETTIDLPDVKDIPGQEFVHPPALGGLADTTISSADEEGEGIFDDDEEDELNFSKSTEGDVGRDERKALANEDYMPTRDEDNLKDARMDSADLEGEPLNEKSFGEERSGQDLDVPGNVDETTTDALGQGDEENKNYSLGGDENDSAENNTGA